MNEYSLQTQSYEDHLADLQKQLEEKGLHDATEKYCDRINSLASCLSYPARREIQECLNDILTLIELDNPDMLSRKKLLDGFKELQRKKPYCKAIMIQDLINALEHFSKEKGIR